MSKQATLIVHRLLRVSSGLAAMVSFDGKFTVFLVGAVVLCLAVLAWISSVR